MVPPLSVAGEFAAEIAEFAEALPKAIQPTRVRSFLGANEEPASPDAAPFGIWGCLTPRITVVRPQI